ncbi:hypothetical protein D3C77_506950 [compost metagenome]
MSYIVSETFCDAWIGGNSFPFFFVFQFLLLIRRSLLLRALRKIATQKNTSEGRLDRFLKVFQLLFFGVRCAVSPVFAEGAVTQVMLQGIRQE